MQSSKKKKSGGCCSDGCLLLILLIIGIGIFVGYVANNDSVKEKVESYVNQPQEKVQEYGKIYFMCGWKNYYKNYSNELETLKQTVEEMYPDIIFTIEQYTWNCGDSSLENNSSNYNGSCLAALNDSEELAQKILELPEEQRRNTVLIGHSLGCSVAIKAMARLSNQEVHIKTAILFGAAIDVDDSDIDYALSVAEYPVISLIHPQDGALMMAKLATGKPQLGLGSYCERNHLVELLIEENQAGSSVDLILGEVRDEYKNNHAFTKFLEKWNELCQSHFENRINEVIVPQDAPNVKEQVMDAEFWWSREAQFYDHNQNLWKLQRHSVTGHYRIVQKTTNNDTYRWASGSEQYMRPAFERVRKQMAP